MQSIKSIAVSLYMAVAAVSLTAGSAHATLIDNVGSTTDTATGLEWLDLTATQGKSYDDVVGGGFGGYIADGYSVATTSQLCGLFGALGDTITACGDGSAKTVDSLTSANASSFIGLLGNTFTSFSGTFGWYDGGDIVGGRVALGCIVFENTACGTLIQYTAATITNWASITNSNPSAGGWLVRSPPLPEPASFALFASGLVWLGFARRRRSPKVTG